MAIQFLLLGHVGQIDKSPGYDAGPAVEEELEVKPLANARVELDPHHVVVEDVPCELAGELQKKVDENQVGTVVLESLTYNYLPLRYSEHCADINSIIITHQSSEFVGKK